MREIKNLHRSTEKKNEKCRDFFAENTSTAGFYKQVFGSFTENSTDLKMKNDLSVLKCLRMFKVS